jgi:uncharacterized protein YxjI
MQYTLTREGFWRSRWAARGADGGDLFVMRSVGSFSVNYELTDLAGTELGRIRDVGGWWRRVYEITIQGQVAAQVRSDGHWIGWRFVVEMPGREPIAVEKPWMSGDFAFRRGGAEVAMVTRAGGLLNRAYDVWLRDDEPQLALLACVVSMRDYIDRNEVVSASS